MTTSQVKSIVNGPETLAMAMGLTAAELESLYQSGYRLMMQAKYREAHSILRLLALCDHTSERTWLALAGCRQMLGDFLLAAESYSTAAALNLHNPTPAIQTVFCLLRCGAPEAAANWLEEAQRRMSNDPGDRAKANKIRLLQRAVQSSLTGSSTSHAQHAQAS